MVIPYFLHAFLRLNSPEIVNDQLFFFGLYFIIILLGTILPFFAMRKAMKVPLKKFNRSTSISFIEIFVQTIVFFTTCLILTYLSNIIFSYVGLGDKLISGIGFSYDEAYLNNWLYVFMLVLVTPIIEEYAFRGVLMNCMAKYGKLFGLIGSSILFALAHMQFAEMIPAFAMGIALGKTALRYKSIQPTIIIHILFNAFIFGLCIMPESIVKYMAYALVAICVLAFALILTGRYEKIRIQSSRSNKISNKLFYSRFTIILVMLLMIGYTCLFAFVK